MKKAGDMAEGGGDDSAGGGAPAVFVSYASQDFAVANALVEALELSGLRCWIAPRDVIAGSLFAEAIVRALNEAKVFVLILSVHAGASPHVGKEIERASAKRRPIIALRADSAPLSPAFEYYLSESQWIDLGSRLTDATVAILVDAVRRHVGPGAAGGLGSNQVASILSDPTKSHGHHSHPWIASTRNTGKRAAIDSIAVLPFTLAGGPASMKFFGEGIAECLIQALSELPGIRKVIARNSAFKYAESDPLDAGRLLGVRAVLTGRLRISRQSASLTAELVDTVDSAHVWGTVTSGKAAPGEPSAPSCKLRRVPPVSARSVCLGQAAGGRCRRRSHRTVRKSHRARQQLRIGPHRARGLLQHAVRLGVRGDRASGGLREGQTICAVCLETRQAVR
jgi:TolB-like protein